MTTMGYKDINKVLKTIKHNADDIDESLFTFKFDDGTSLKVTSSHGIYIRRDNTNTYLPNKLLQVGDYVKYSDGSYHKITEISNEELTNTVYNLSVDNTHNFYVTDNQILVHNTNNDSKY